MKSHILYFVFRVFCFFAFLVFFVFICLLKPKGVGASRNYWEIQSIDTMKYSRDMAREWGNNLITEKIIQSYIEKIASTGANYMAVGTPYDNEFIPFMKFWVEAARKSGLKVWFRGNFSGWEGWFGYPKITKEDYLEKLSNFILANENLFEEGDVFTPCTECENGALGDPRETNNLKEYREFLIKTYDVSIDAFDKISKKVKVGFYSMNADVARLVMDKMTTKKLGDVVVIDHYVKDPEKLALDVEEISELSGGKVVLGEFGAPVPDIHGEMNEEEQSEWIGKVLNHLSKVPSLIGVNYWVSFGGTTAIWNNDGSEKPSVSILRGYYSPDVLRGKLLNALGNPVKKALIIVDSKKTTSNENGEFEILISPSSKMIVIDAYGYREEIREIVEVENIKEIVLEKKRENLLFKFQKFIYEIFKRIKKTNLFD